MDQFYRRLARTATPLSRPLGRLREHRAIEQAHKSESESDSDYDDVDSDVLLVRHPSPSSCPSRTVGGPQNGTPSPPQSYVRKAPRLLHAPRPASPLKLRAASAQTYTTPDDLRREFNRMAREPPSPVKSAVSTTITALVPQVTITALESALESLEQEVIVPSTVTSCPSSPKVLQENLTLLLS